MKLKIILTLGIIFGLFLTFAATQPSEFRVSRSAILDAPPQDVFAQINNMHSWGLWSPWDKLDPEMKKTFEGPSEGVGASYSWSGNFEVGQGRSTIVASQPFEFVRFKLEMIEPFAAVNDVEFALKDESGKTNVTWLMVGHKNLIAKVMGIFMDCEKMVGTQFEEGLSNLRTLVEQKASVQNL